MTGHVEELCRLRSPEGLDVVDVGAGDGAFAVRLAARGARVTGVEVEADKVAAAQATHGEAARFVLGRAEALPLADASADVITFIQSLHHVPIDAHPKAMAEALRVLRPGGRLHIAEPDLDGDVTAIVQPLDDETRVRTEANRFLATSLLVAALRPVARRGYIVTRRYRDFEALAQALCGVSAARAARLDAARPEMQARFDRLARPVEDGFEIDQTVTLHHYERP